VEGEGSARTRFSTPTAPAWLRLGKLILILVFVAFAAHTVVISWSSPHNPRRTVNDFTVDFVSARAFLDGGKPYADTNALARRYLSGTGVTQVPFGDQHARNPHPPAYILLVVPLARLPYSVARNVWLIVMTLSVAVAMGLVARTARGSIRIAVAVALCTLALPPVSLELRIGESNALILLALVVGWREIRKGRQVWGGAALGVASAVKLYPLFLLIPLLRKRSNKAALAQLGTSGVITVATGFMFGLPTLLRVVTQVIPTNSRYWLAAPHNLSLVAIPFRWLTVTRWNEGPMDAPLVAFLIALGLGLLCVSAAARTRAGLSQDMYWAAIPWMLLATPLCWYQYTVLVLPLIYLVLNPHLSRSQLPPWFAVIAIALILIWTTDLLPTGGRESVVALLAAFALPTYGLLILGVFDGISDGSGTPVAMTNINA
jgi:Glycosyltransferase family 87